ncbi:MAG: type II secretion system protein GspD [Nitrospinota bacterium]|nr:MAG: type II secretion system protein GspD [Nitrospinota bacterium]
MRSGRINSSRPNRRLPLISSGTTRRKRSPLKSAEQRGRDDPVMWKRKSMVRQRICWSVIMILLLLASSGYPLRLDDEPTPKLSARRGGDNMISLDFDNVDLRVVIKFISELTGKNFLVDDKVKGKVTIISPTRIPVEEAYDIFLSILDIQGFAAVPSGDVIKIVPARDVKQKAVPTQVGSDLQQIPRDDRIVTQLIPLEHADANEIRTILTPLIRKEGTILSYPPTNTLIVTDTLANIRRLLEIVREIDVESTREEITVIPLEHALASDLASTITATMEVSRQQRPAQPQRRPIRRRRARGVQPTLTAVEKVFKVIPESRTNSLIVVATPEDLAVVKKLVTQLDVPAPKGRGQIHVYYVQYAVAEDLAKVLTAQAAEIQRIAAPPKAPIPSGQRAAPAARPQPRTVSGEIPGQEQKITITADKATNSLVISASPEQYEMLLEVIKKLDIPRPQVYVEAAIVEISLDKTKELGFEFRSTQDFTEKKEAVPFGGTSFGLINQAIQNPFGLSGLSIGLIEGTITFGGQTFLNIGALLRAIQDERGVNVLSTPHLLTTDNEEAEIIVANNVPFVTSTSQTEISTVTNIERRDVGITLRFTPQIGEGGTVRLNIFQEISAIQETVTGLAASQVGPTTSKRSAKTSVVVRDKQTVVIGGLMQDNVNSRQTKVPCLGDVPFLGRLFSFASERGDKTNLLIFITPTIVRNATDLQKIGEQVDEKSRKFSRETGEPQEIPSVREPTILAPTR